MNILIIGAMGRVGQCMLKLLASTEHQVTAVIRDKKYCPEVEILSAEPLVMPLESDLSDIAKHQDTVVFVAGSGGAQVYEIDFQGTCKAIKSAVEHDVKHFILLSSCNVGKIKSQYTAEADNFFAQHEHLMSLALLDDLQSDQYQNYLEMKTLAEQVLIHSCLNYTILRTGLKTKQIRSNDKISLSMQDLTQLSAFGMTSRLNIANSLLQIIENSSLTQNKIYTVFDGNDAIDRVFVDFA